MTRVIHHRDGDPHNNAVENLEMREMPTRSYPPHGKFWFAKEASGYAIGSGDAEFAFVHADSKGESDMEKARLIAQQMAAAPELAAALLHVRDEYRDLLRAAITDDERDDCNMMLWVVDRALEKAGIL